MTKKQKIDYRPQLLPNQYHHCVNHAIAGNLLFRESENYRFFLEKYKKISNEIEESFNKKIKQLHVHLLPTYFLHKQEKEKA